MTAPATPENRALSAAEEARRRSLDLLESTRRETRMLLSALDPERVIHTDERAWRVRDILGHIGVWNGEAARSLEAYEEGGEYHCVPGDGVYFEYNGLAADERSAWTMEQVWAEYESTHDQLSRIIASMPAEKWDGQMTYPWNEPGTVERLINIMMTHEKVDHCGLVVLATGRDSGK